MIRKIFLVLFFTLQIVGIIYARFTLTRYFCWAPYDQISTYEIQVHIDQKILTEQEIKFRYHIPALGRENRSIHNLITIIQTYEQTYGRKDGVNVKLIYSTNGKTPQIWQWHSPH